MSWAKLDDQFYDHPKIRPLSVPAAYLWVCSIGYCARHLTDGVISEDAAELLISMRKAGATFEAMRDELLAAGLWDAGDEGKLVVHDYLDYNPTRESVLADREAARLRMAGKRNKGRSSPEVHPNLDRSSSSPSPSPSPSPDKISLSTTALSNSDEPDEDAVDRRVLKRRIKDVYDHYIKESGRSPVEYKLTSARRDKIRLRLRNFGKRYNNPEDALKTAISAMCASAYHQGDNDNGKRYIDLVDHCLKSEERVEKWLVS